MSWISKCLISCTARFSTGHPPSRTPYRLGAWRAAPWLAPCRCAQTLRTASAASPTRCVWSASPADTSTATPAVTRSSTWPLKTLRACLTIPAPCASPSASSGASGRRPPGTWMGPTASCSSSQRRTTAVGGDRTAPLLLTPFIYGPHWHFMLFLHHHGGTLTWTITDCCTFLASCVLHLWTPTRKHMTTTSSNGLSATTKLCGIFPQIFFSVGNEKIRIYLVFFCMLLCGHRSHTGQIKAEHLPFALDCLEYFIVTTVMSCWGLDSPFFSR